jgi:carbonic anhydrase
MIKFIAGAVAAMLIAVIGTLSVVTFSRTRSLETRVTALQKQMRETSGSVSSLTESVAMKEDRKGDPHATPHWGYEGDIGPAKWGETFATCGTGREQSPVNIVGPFEKAEGSIKLGYHPMLLKVLNNGHTIQVNAEAGNTMTVGTTTYELLQFHFHRPSEELVAGKPAAMVAHFVHKSAEGKLAVLGVLLNEGYDNPVIKAIWSNAPKTETPETTVPGVAINLSQIIPANLDFYSYAGSLTTPPCTEGVMFYILKTPGAMSRAQVEQFPFKLNARPVQPLNDRHISAS